MRVYFILLKRTKTTDFVIRLTQQGKRKYKFIRAPFTPREWNYDKQQLKGVSNRAETATRDRLKANKLFIAEIVGRFQEVIDSELRIGKPFTLDEGDFYYLT